MATPPAPRDPSHPVVKTPPLTRRHDEAVHEGRHGTRAPNLDYTTEHTAADPAHVATEEYVPNEQKALPSQAHTSLLLAFAAAGAALLAVILEWMGLDTVALVIALVAVLAGIVSIVMAYNDARAGVGAPILCTIVSAVVLTVVLMDVFEVDERVDQLAVPGTTVDPDAIPADPAEIEPADVARDPAQVNPE